MSRRSWNNGLVRALLTKGAIDRHVAHELEAEIEAHPEVTTLDIVRDAGVVTEDVLDVTLQELKEAGSSIALTDGMKFARQRHANTTQAGLQLSLVAVEIAKKG